MKFSHQTDLQQEIEAIDDVALQNKLILHNDHHNTFEWVIKTLIEVCNHTPEQAEQCSYIVHNKNKCSVKHGSYAFLKPMKDAITERGIGATIE